MTVAKPRKLNNGGMVGRLTSSAEGSSKHSLFIIDDETINDPRVRDMVFVPTINGEAKGHGLVPRDYRTFPAEMFAPPSDMPLVEESEIDGRIDEQERQQSSFEHLADWPSLDQNGQGYCWCYSTTGAVMMLRKLNNQPHVRLSAHGLACRIKGFRDQGGWCGESAKGQRETGCPSVALWPEKSMSRSHDKPEVWANAALHKVTEEWVDMTRDIYDQNLTLRQIDSCCLFNVPMAWDFNWWSHSVFGGRVLKVEAGSRGRKIRNSWTDGWGERGWGILRGSKAIPDGAVALRVTGASPT